MMIATKIETLILSWAKRLRLRQVAFPEPVTALEEGKGQAALRCGRRFDIDAITQNPLNAELSPDSWVETQSAAENDRKKIIVFSKYFGYAVGGAEHSTLALLKDKERQGCAIKVLMVENVESFDAQRLRMELPDSWEIETIRLGFDTVHFRFASYAATRRAVAAALRRQDPQAVLYAYGTLAPIAVNAFPGRSVYLIRDEMGLGWDINYYSGVKRRLRDVYAVAEAPFRALWRRDLRHAMAKSHLIANSRFMAAEAEKLAGHAAEIIYPHVDGTALRAAYDSAKAVDPAERGIVAIGDNRLKGGDIVRAIARQMPDRRFYLFDRSHAARRQDGNLVLMPWHRNRGQVYRYATLVIVPSRWAEAFGRTAVEARLLGLPVLGTRRGGIPEALDDDPALLIDAPEDIDAWRNRIQRILADSASPRT